jgi:acetaldehyde dehydrogenase (acetylating)
MGGMLVVADPVGMASQTKNKNDVSAHGGGWKANMKGQIDRRCHVSLGWKGLVQGLETEAYSDSLGDGHFRNEWAGGT